MLFSVLFFGFIAFTYGFPANDKFVVDSKVVESIVRETRAAPSEAEDLIKADDKKSFVRTYGDKESKKNDKGYHRKSEDKGSEGYKHFDSYHKKDGDKYGFETHSAYGNAKHGSAGGGGGATKYGDDYKHGHDGDSEESKHVFKIEDLDHDHFDEAPHGYYSDDSGHSGEYFDGGDSGHYTDGSHGSSEDHPSGNDDGNHGSAEYSAHYTSGEGSSEDDGGKSEHYDHADHEYY